MPIIPKFPLFWKKLASAYNVNPDILTNSFMNTDININFCELEQFGTIPWVLTPLSYFNRTCLTANETKPLSQIKMFRSFAYALAWFWYTNFVPWRCSSLINVSRSFT